MKNRKTFIIDTSVLLYDKYSIHSFPQSDIIIPLDVLDELDRFKDRPGLLGESARYVNRYLDDLRSEGSLHKGIEIEDGQNIKVDVSNDFLIPSALSKDSADNRIIGLAASLKKKIKSTVTIITKDINFSVSSFSINFKEWILFRSKISLILSVV